MLNLDTLDCRREQITPDDIVNGVAGHCFSCPVALAVQRMFPEVIDNHYNEYGNIEVNNHAVNVVDELGNTLVLLYITDDLQKWIGDFDSGENVEPIELIIGKTDRDGYNFQLNILNPFVAAVMDGKTD